MQPLTAERSDQADILDAVFDADYLDLHEPLTTAERSRHEANLAAALLDRRPPAMLLDLCCGHGRLARLLAADGYRMAGIDQSAPAIARARSEAAAAGVAVDYTRGDAMRLPYADSSFDGALCWFTSFGLCDDAGNRRILAEAARVLRPGARLALDLVNPFYLTAGFQRHAVYEAPGGRMMLDSHSFDISSMRLWIERRFIGGDRPERRLRFFLRQFTLPELTSWLLDAGFATVVAVDNDGGPFTPASGVMIVVAEKAG